MSLETEVEILKKEISDIKQIHLRLDTAINKISDVSNSINRMLAVHEEKLSRQEEEQTELNKAIESRRNDFSEQIQLLHKRISDQSRETMDLMSKQHTEQTEKINTLKSDVNDRVGVLEKWRCVLIGGSIVAGFILHKLINLNL